MAENYGEGAMSGKAKETLEEAIKRLEKEMQCNCNLDCWVPEKNTGHSWVCRIHKKVVELLHRNKVTR